MIISRKAPELVQAPVRVSRDRVEIWYSKPKSLGYVDKIGSYWYTVDGGKFRSSREAMRYLVKLEDMGVIPLPSDKRPPAIVRRAPRTQERFLGNLDLTDPMVLDILKLLSARATGTGRKKNKREPGSTDSAVVQ